METSVRSIPEYQVASALWKFCPPFLFILGTFGNVMTIIILRRLVGKPTALPVYLTTLALSDTCVLYFGLFRRWLMYIFEVDIRLFHPALCKTHTWLVYSVILMSAWLLAVMTMERAISVWLPHHVTLLCTRRRAVFSVVCILVFSLTVNSHFLYGVEVTFSITNGTLERDCNAPTSSTDYWYFVHAIWPWIDFTLSSLMPLVALIIGNSIILWKVSDSARAAQNLTAASIEDRPDRRKQISFMTVSLVTLSVVFFLTTTPICVYNVIEHYVQDSMSDAQGDAQLTLVWAVVNMFMYTNSAVNFYLYCLSGAKFRKEFKRFIVSLFLKPKPLSPEKSHILSSVLDGSARRYSCKTV